MDLGTKRNLAIQGNEYGIKLHGDFCFPDAGTKLSNVWQLSAADSFEQWSNLNAIAQNMAVFLPAPRA